jgi:hypothetical protein
MFEGTADFDPGVGVYNLTSTGDRDIFISKLDAAGNFLWAKQIGGPLEDLGLSIAVDVSGNVYTTGRFRETADFDPGAGVYNLTSAGDTDIFISKLDALGNFVWAKQIGGTSQDMGFSIAADASGNVYTTGSFVGTVDFDPGTATFNLTGNWDIFISKLDAAGDFVWAKQMGGTSVEIGFGIAVDGSGNVYTTGYFSGSADFDPGAGTYNLTTVGFSDIFISKLDAAGNFVWAKQFNGTGQVQGNSIAADASGNVYTTGIFTETADFDPGAGAYTFTSGGSWDIFISKLDATGNLVWAKQMGGASQDYGRSITVDGLGNVYTTGNFGGTADFDPGAGAYNLTSAGTFDIFISKLDASGDFAWAQRFGETGWNFGNSITLDAAGNVYTTGSFEGTVDFDAGTGVSNLTSAGYRDIFIHKMSQTSLCQLTASITGEATVCNGATETYTANNESGASYNWIVTGGTISSGAGTNEITVLWGSTGNGSVKVEETLNGCNSEETLLVTINSTPASPVITATYDNGDPLNNNTLSLGASDFECANLTLSSLPTGSTVEWKEGTNTIGSSNSIRVCPATTTTYTALVSSGGCTNSTSINIIVEDVTWDNPTKNIKICHKGKEMYVHPNALNIHLKHGDNLGTCLSAQQSASVFSESQKPMFIAYPNPSASNVNISFTTVTDEKVTLELFDVNGKLIKVLYQGESKKHIPLSFNLKTSSLPAQLYFVRLTSGNISQTLKLVLIK